MSYQEELKEYANDIQSGKSDFKIFWYEKYMDYVGDDNNQKYDEVRLELIKTSHKRGITIFESLDEISSVKDSRVSSVIFSKVPNVSKARIDGSEYVEPYEWSKNYSECGIIKMFQHEKYICDSQYRQGDHPEWRSEAVEPWLLDYKHGMISFFLKFLNNFNISIYEKRFEKKFKESFEIEHTKSILWVLFPSNFSFL